eukprot:scaffold5449_cov52-Cyclotella_meneghiniana.AAC.7
MNGVEINECPRFLASDPTDSTHSVIIHDPEDPAQPLHIPLRLDEVISHFEYETPSMEEVQGDQYPWRSIASAQRYDYQGAGAGPPSFEDDTDNESLLWNLSQVSLQYDAADVTDKDNFVQGLSPLYGWGAAIADIANEVVFYIQSLTHDEATADKWSHHGRSHKDVNNIRERVDIPAVASAVILELSQRNDVRAASTLDWLSSVTSQVRKKTSVGTCLTTQTNLLPTGFKRSPEHPKSQLYIAPKLSIKTTSGGRGEEASTLKPTSSLSPQGTPTIRQSKNYSGSSKMTTTTPTQPTIYESETVSLIASSQHLRSKDLCQTTIQSICRTSSSTSPKTDLSQAGGWIIVKRKQSRGKEHNSKQSSSRNSNETTPEAFNAANNRQGEKRQAPMMSNILNSVVMAAGMMGGNQNNEGDGNNNNQNNQERANKGVQFQDSPNQQHRPPRVSMDGAATTKQDEDVVMSEPMSPPAKKRAAERSPHKSPSAAPRLSKYAKLSTKFPVALNESKKDEPNTDKTPKGMTQEEKIALINDHEWKGELLEAENFADLVDQGVDRYEFKTKKKGAQESMELLRQCDYFELAELLGKKANSHGKPTKSAARVIPKDLSV